MSSAVQPSNTKELLSNRKHGLDTMIDLTAGTMAGVSNCLSGQPLDTVKVKMQTFPSLYRGAFQCFMKTWRNDGVLRGLYAGTVPALIANVAENSILFMSYGLCQKVVMCLVGLERLKDLRTVHKASAGSGASFFAAVVLTPTELIKCRLQAMREMVDAGKLDKSKVFSGTSALTKHILKTEGLRGLFRGFVPTVAREMPGYFCFFGAYEMSRNMLSDGHPDELGPFPTILCGGFGGVVLWTAIFPADVVKSRIQIASGKTQGFIATTVDVVRNDGFIALYRGLSPTLIRTFISSGCLFLTYEYTKKAMEYFVY